MTPSGKQTGPSALMAGLSPQGRSLGRGASRRRGDPASA